MGTGSPIWNPGRLLTMFAPHCQWAFPSANIAVHMRAGGVRGCGLGTANRVNRETIATRRDGIIGERAEPDAIAIEAARLAALPEFPKAVRQYTLATARFRESPRLANKLISYHTRWRVVGYLLYLAADRETFGPLGGATYGRLLELCTARKTASPRVLKTVLALLKITGFIETASDGLDRRLKYYRPTAKMAPFIDRWLGYAVTTLDILQPEASRTGLLHDDPGLAERFFVTMGRGHATGQLLTDRMPEYTAFFADRDGATAVMLMVMLADIDSTPVPSRAAIAQRFGFSKSQITRVLVEGEALGYFKLDAAGIPTPTQRLRDDYRRWISIELAFYAEHIRPAHDVEEGLPDDKAAPMGRL